METELSGSSALSLETKLISDEVDKPLVGSRVASYSLRLVQSAVSIAPASCSPFFPRMYSYPIWSDAL